MQLDRILGNIWQNVQCRPIGRSQSPQSPERTRSDLTIDKSRVGALAHRLHVLKALGKGLAGVLQWFAHKEPGFEGRAINVSSSLPTLLPMCLCEA